MLVRILFIFFFYKMLEIREQVLLNMFMINICVFGGYNVKILFFVIQVYFINVGVLKIIKGVLLYINFKVFYNIFYLNF